MKTSKHIVLLFTVMVSAILLAASVALAATIQGGSSNDTITGTSGQDKLYGGGGNDTVSGLGYGDEIHGQDGNDKLFGGDESQAIRGGNDLAYGGYGDDTLVGASGADKLYGGPGADTLIEGPADDVSADVLSGADGNDTIAAATIPAVKDNVYCGNGTDQVQVDPLDVVASDCESVQIFQEDPGEEMAEPDSGVPAVVPSAPESDVADDESMDPGPTDPNEETATVDGGKVSFFCKAAGAFRGATYCANAGAVPVGWKLDVGLRNAEPTRWIRFQARDQGGFFSTRRLHEDHDPADEIVEGRAHHNYVGLYANTSCFSPGCAFSTKIKNAWFHEHR